MPLTFALPFAPNVCLSSVLSGPIAIGRDETLAEGRGQGPASSLGDVSEDLFCESRGRVAAKDGGDGAGAGEGEQGFVEEEVLEVELGGAGTGEGEEVGEFF